MSFFKLFNYRHILPQPRLFSRFPTRQLSNRAFFSSMVLSVSLLNIFKQYFQYNSSQKDSPKPETPQITPIKTIEWEVYTENLYEECLKQKNEVIIVMNLNDYKESFREEIESAIVRISQLKQFFSKKTLRFLRVELKTPEEKKKFEEKHQIKTTGNVLFFVKNRYIDSLIRFTLPDFFAKKDYLLMLFAKIRKLSAKNYNDFSKYLKNSTNETVIILLYNPKKSPNYEISKKKYAKLATDQRFLSQQNVAFLMIKEESIGNSLKLDAKPGDLFIMQKSNKLNYDKSNFELDNLKFAINSSKNIAQFTKTSEIIEQLVQTTKKNNVFAIRGFESHENDYSFNVEIDLNKFEEQDLKVLYTTLAEVREELSKKNVNINETVGFFKIHKSMKKKGLRIFIRNEQKLFKHIMERETTSLKELETLYMNEPVPDINEPASFTYIFEKDMEITKENLIKFIENALENKLPQNFQSQKPPKFRAFSKKIVGKTFRKEIIDNSKNQVLFIYSKHCFACKRFGKYYEDLALENLKNSRNDIEFNRMNSDHNEIDCMRRFNYTPVFLVFKAGEKKNPCIYLNEKMTPDMLKAFIENSVDYKVMSDGNVKKAYEELIRKEVELI